MLKINLLPSQEKESIKIKEINKWFVFFFVGLGFWLVVFFVICLSSYLYFQNLVSSQEQMIKTAETNSQIQQLKEAEKEINSINSDISKIHVLFSNFVYWTPIIEKLAQEVTPGIYLNVLSYNSGSNQMRLDGFAQTRANLLDFEKTIKGDNNFKNFDSPISNLLKQTKIDFSFNFEVNTLTAKSL